jgi:hypothetical protein
MRRCFVSLPPQDVGATGNLPVQPVTQGSLSAGSGPERRDYTRSRVSNSISRCGSS